MVSAEAGFKTHFEVMKSAIVSSLSAGGAAQKGGRFFQELVPASQRKGGQETSKYNFHCCNSVMWNILHYVQYTERGWVLSYVIVAAWRTVGC